MSISSGKGHTLEDAEVGALAEAAERFCAEPRGHVEIRAAGPGSPNAKILDAAAPMEWCLGREIAAAGEPTWLPAAAVLFPFYGRGDVPFRPNTIGLAAGATLEQAILHGLLECVEWDGFSRALLWASVGIGTRCPPLDTSGFPRATREIIDAATHAGMRVLMRDVTGDAGIPTVACTISDDILGSHGGCAADLDASRAADRALLEAIQSRAVDIQGAREDLEQKGAAPAHSWFTSADGEPKRPLPTGLRLSSAEDAIREVVRRLREIGLDCPAYVRLSRPEVPLEVVRVVVPGVELWAADPSRRGPRYQRWLDEASSS